MLEISLYHRRFVFIMILWTEVGESTWGMTQPDKIMYQSALLSFKITVISKFLNFVYSEKVNQHKTSEILIHVETWEKRSEALSIYQWTSNLIWPGKFSNFDKGQKWLLPYLKPFLLQVFNFCGKRCKETGR